MTDMRLGSPLDKKVTGKLRLCADVKLVIKVVIPGIVVVGDYYLFSRYRSRK